MAEQRAHPAVDVLVSGVVVIAVVSIVLAAVAGVMLLILWIASYVGGKAARSGEPTPPASPNRDAIALLPPPTRGGELALLESAPIAKHDAPAIATGKAITVAVATILAAAPVPPPTPSCPGISQDHRARPAPVAPQARSRRRWLKAGLAFCLLGVFVMATDGGEDRVGGTLLYLFGAGWFFWRLRRHRMTRPGA